MTSSRTTRAGFTLLEMMLVMALIVIIFIGAAPLVSSSMRERRLRNAMTELTDAVRWQRMEAQESGIRTELEITSDGLAAPDGEGGWDVIFVPPEGMDFSVKLPGGKWADAGGQRWEFSAMGMVTPLSIRMAEGADWIEADFDMLTGRVADERYAF